MGARVTTLENKSSKEVEVRVFVPPDRPDHFRKIIRIKAGEKKPILAKSLCDWEISPERPVMVMIFVEGVYTGVSLLPLHLVGYSRVIWDRSELGLVHLQGIKPLFFDLFMPRCCGMEYFEGPKVDII